MKFNNKKLKFNNDFYYKKSKELNLISRSWFKIYEINKKFNIIKNNYNIIDLGSSPGGWSKYLSNIIKFGNIFSFDILPMKNINNVNFFIGDINNDISFYDFIKYLKNYNINIILSDILPNVTGLNIIDDENMINIVNNVIKMCKLKLIKNGSLVIKIMQSKYNKLIIYNIKKIFNNIKIFKPKSSKSFSREIYIIALHFLLN